jgi:N-acyl-D-aspartate/D-glutamate deacylase
MILRPDPGQDDASCQKRVSVWRDPRTLVGASDAGAHLDMMDSFSYATTMLARAVRERELLPLEEAISLLTDAPASLYDLPGGTGRIYGAAEGIEHVFVGGTELVAPGGVMTDALPGTVLRVRARYRAGQRRPCPSSTLTTVPVTHSDEGATR